MIQIEYSIDKLALTVEGHANADEHGKDLVCCAVSTLVQTLAFAAEQLGRNRCEVQQDIRPGKACIHLTAKDGWGIECLYTYLTVLKGLQAVAMSYPDYVEMQRMGERERMG